MEYALFGATGAVGKALAAKLAKKGQPFRAVGRSEERLRRDFRAMNHSSNTAQPT